MRDDSRLLHRTVLEAKYGTSLQTCSSALTAQHAPCSLVVHSGSGLWFGFGSSCIYLFETPKCKSFMLLSPDQVGSWWSGGLWANWIPNLFRIDLKVEVKISVNLLNVTQDSQIDPKPPKMSAEARGGGGPSITRLLRLSSAAQADTTRAFLACSSPLEQHNAAVAAPLFQSFHKMTFKAFSIIYIQSIFIMIITFCCQTAGTAWTFRPRNNLRADVFKDIPNFFLLHEHGTFCQHCCSL